MNINFGEFFYTTRSSGFLYDLLITFISAFLGFFVALMINRWMDKKSLKKEKKNEEKEYLSNLRYLSQLLDSVLKSYPNQAKNYSDLAIAVKEKPLEIQLPHLYATYDLARLKDLDSKVLRDSYFHFFSKTENSINSYRRIFSSVDFLFLLFNDLIKQNENHRNFTHKDQLFVKDCFEEVGYRLGLKEKNIQKENPKNFKNIPEYQYLHQFGEKFIKITRDILVFQNVYYDFFKPLHDSILYKIEDNEFVDSIFLLVKKAISRLHYIEFNSKKFAEDMEQVELRIKDVIEFLTRVNDEIKRKTSHNN